MGPGFAGRESLIGSEQVPQVHPAGPVVGVHPDRAQLVQTAAELIWELTVRAHPDRLPELDPFVYAASEWRERPEDGALFTGAVRAASADLLAG